MLSSGESLSDRAVRKAANTLIAPLVAAAASNRILAPRNVMWTPILFLTVPLNHLRGVPR